MRLAGMERLELSKTGLKNLARDRFAFIPRSNINAGEENRTPKTGVLSAGCLPLASLPRHWLQAGVTPVISAL